MDLTSGLINIQLRRAFLRVVFSIETSPLRQQNPFLNFHEDMSLVTEISAITVIHFRCLVKRLKMQASLKMLQEERYLNEIDTFPRKFCVHSVYQFKHTTSKFTL